LGGLTPDLTREHYSPENAPTTEGQTCEIAPKVHFLGAITLEP